MLIIKYETIETWNLSKNIRIAIFGKIESARVLPKKILHN